MPLGPGLVSEQEELGEVAAVVGGGLAGAGGFVCGVLGALDQLDGPGGGWSCRWREPWTSRRIEGNLVGWGSFSNGGLVVAVLQLPGRAALARPRPGPLGGWWNLLSRAEHLAGLVDECGGVSAKAGGPGRELPAEGGGGPVVPRGASPWEPRPVRSRVGGEGLVRCEVESGASHGGTWGGGALFGGSAGRSWGHWPPWA